MIFTIVKVFVKIGEVLTEAIKGVIRLVFKYPVQTAGLVLVGLALYFTYEYAYSRGVKSKTEEVTQLTKALEEVNKDIEDKNKKITELEADSATIAAVNSAVIDELANQLTTLKSKYSEAVKDAAHWKKQSGNREVIYLPAPGPGPNKGNVEVRLQDGKVVCDRYYDEHVKTINSMVDEAINKMRQP